MENLLILRLKLSRKFHLYVYNIAMIFAILILFLITPKQDATFDLFRIAFVLIYIYNCRIFLFFLNTIVVLEDEVIFVKKYLKEIKVRKEDIISINVKFGGMLEIKIKNNKKIIGFCDFDGFSRFVENIRMNNNNLITKGC